MRKENVSILMNYTVLEKEELRGLVADYYKYKRSQWGKNYGESSGAT